MANAKAAALHFVCLNAVLSSILGCHYYERFRSEISGDYFAAGQEHGHGSGWWLAFIPSRSSGLLIELIQAILASNA